MTERTGRVFDQKLESEMKDAARRLSSNGGRIA